MIYHGGNVNDIRPAQQPVFARQANVQLPVVRVDCQLIFNPAKQVFDRSA